MAVTSRSLLHSKVHELLSSNEAGIRILSVSGPGGIGKTWAINEALADFDLIGNGIIKISLDGADRVSAVNPVEFLGRYLTPQIMMEPAHGGHDHFNNTREIIEGFRDINADAAKHEGLKDLIDKGSGLVQLLIETGEYLGMVRQKKSTTKESDPLREAALNALEIYRNTRSIWPWNTLSDRLKDNPVGVLVDAVVLDYTAVSRGFKVSDTEKYRRFTQGRIDGCQKILMVIDDYEMLHEVIGEFLLTGILAGFRDRRLPIRILFIGRDRISDVDLRFRQYFSAQIVEECRLEVLPKQEGIAALEKAGFMPMEADEIYSETGGYPFLIGYYIEHGKQGAQSALGAKNLYERTTKWMTDQQKDWLRLVLNMENVDRRHLLAAGKDQEEAEAILNWFTAEASLRDPTTEVFVVNALLRRHLMRYYQVMEG